MTAAADDDHEEIELDLAADPRSLANAFRSPVRSDPWGRWQAGEEPVRVVEIERLVADDSGTLLVRMPRVEIEAGVLPDPSPLDEESLQGPKLIFLGRWNARWRGTQLAELSLDMFCDEWPEVIRIEFDPTHPVDLRAVYAAAFPGLWGITVCKHGTSLRNARDQPHGHQVTCRDSRLAVQIAARCPGIALHQPYLEIERYSPERADQRQGQGALRGHVRSGGCRARRAGARAARHAGRRPAARRVRDGRRGRRTAAGAVRRGRRQHVGHLHADRHHGAGSARRHPGWCAATTH
jgi:hypothetical protein